ncbi:MAG: BNR repeat-containing protein [Rikenellaceae bacterium]
MKKYILICAVAISVAACANRAKSESVTLPQITEEAVVDEVWVANRAFFDFKTVNGKQFVAYYNKNRSMTVASRNEGDTAWVRTVLPNKLHWDTHNYVTLGIDKEGYVHVSGNMHVNPLAYFRSEKPYDVSTMLTLNSMIGDKEEERVTYPNFFNSPAGDLYYSYRSGTCGDGNIMVNKFDTETLSWSRYLNEPLFLGVEENSDRAAYHRFIVDEQGTFHYIWMWRWTPMVETCHQLCYASTTDLKEWKNGAGEVVNLPFRPDTQALIVDNAPTKGGLHNGKYNIITDANHKPYIAYLKYDDNGNTQLYLSTIKSGEWRSKVLTNWNFRWKFIEGGDKMTMGASFDLEGFVDDKYLVISWKNEKGESGRNVIDIDSFEEVDGNGIEVAPTYPDCIKDPMTDRGFTVQNIFDDGESSQEGVKYLLKWETDQATHGKHKPEVMPTGPTSNLLMLKVER